MEPPSLIIFPTILTVERDILSKLVTVNPFIAKHVGHVWQNSTYVRQMVQTLEDILFGRVQNIKIVQQEKREWHTEF